jgi:hypothetical protein
MKRIRTWALIGLIVALIAFLVPWSAVADKIGMLVDITDGASGGFAHKLIAPAGSSITGGALTLSGGTISDGNDTEINRLSAAVKALSTAPMNGTVGASTPAAGAFTTLSASSTVSGNGFSAYLASPPAIGGTAPAAIAGTTGIFSGAVTGASFTSTRTAANQILKLYQGTGVSNYPVTFAVPATDIGGNATITFGKTLDFYAGTYTDGKYCTYTASGTVIACNSTPGTIGGTLGATTNVIPKANGTGTATLQASGITEDGTSVSIGALNLVSTGYIQGKIKIDSDANGEDNTTMAAAGMYGTLFIATGAGTWTLPTAVQGMSMCLMSSGSAADLILDVQGTDTMRLKGTEDSAGDGITNAAAKAAGDFVCVVAVANNKWSTMGMQGAWVAQ